MSNKNIFVYAVCGVDKWLDQLNISLKYLKNFSKNEIIVVTDLSRNKTEILHDNIINIKTPNEFDNKKASLFLKTSLHKILDMTNNYCYLDSHIIAVKKGVDRIFNHNYGKITFSPDFCKINKASPYLASCNCRSKRSQEQKELNEIFIKYKDYKDEGKCLTDVLEDESNLLRKLKIKLTALFQVNIKKLFFKYYNESKQHRSGEIDFNFYKVFKIKLFDKFNIKEEWVYKKYNKAWLNESNEIIFCEHLQLSDYIERISGFRYDKKICEWVNKDNFIIFAEPICNHLADMIKNEFGVSLTKPDWQHWNSSVFLFNSKSVDFLDLWHKFTLQLLRNDLTRINDITSLSAAVWKSKIQNRQNLPTEFQLIANLKANNVKYIRNGEYSIDEGKTLISPYFINFGNGFGNNSWEIRNSVENILNITNQ
jgi:hypothetical protein